MSVHRAALRQQLPSSFICRPAVLGHAGGGEGGREWGEGGGLANGPASCTSNEQWVVIVFSAAGGWRRAVLGVHLASAMVSLRASPEPHVAAAAG